MAFTYALCVKKYFLIFFFSETTSIAKILVWCVLSFDLGGLFENAFMYGWFFSPQICNTAYSIFILCWWSCFLLQWKIERNVKQITHSPITFTHLHSSMPHKLCLPMTIDVEPLCCPLLRLHTRPRFLLLTQVHFPAVILSCPYIKLVFFTRTTPIGFKTLQVSSSVSLPHYIQPVLSSAARVILLKPESHYIIPLLEIIWWLPFVTGKGNIYKVANKAQHNSLCPSLISFFSLFALLQSN